MFATAKPWWPRPIISKPSSTPSSTGDLLDGLNLKFHVRNSSALSDMHRTSFGSGRLRTPINVGQSIRPLRRMASVGMTLVDNAPTAAPQDGSKLALMIDLLRRADGATIVDLTQATGWLAHSTPR